MGTFSAPTRQPSDLSPAVKPWYARLRPLDTTVRNHLVAHGLPSQDVERALRRHGSLSHAAWAVLADLHHNPRDCHMTEEWSECPVCYELEQSLDEAAEVTRSTRNYHVHVMDGGVVAVNSTKAASVKSAASSRRALALQHKDSRNRLGE